MAKKPQRRRSSKNFFVHKDSPQNGLSTLAADGVKSSTSPSLNQDCLIHSVDIINTIRDLTPGEGPIEFGIADSALTVTEIAEALDAAPTHSNDVPAIEHAARKVRTVGTFSGTLESEKFNEGRPRRVKLNWFVAAVGDFPQVWARNRSGAVLTTGAVIETNTKWYCTWKF